MKNFGRNESHLPPPSYGLDNNDITKPRYEFYANASCTSYNIIRILLHGGTHIVRAAVSDGCSSKSPLFSGARFAETTKLRFSY